MSFEKLIRKNSTPLDTFPTSFYKKGTLRGKIKAILFDVYGTLFISKAGDIQAARDEAFRNISEIADLMRKYGVTGSSEDILDKFFNSIKEDKKELVDQGVDFPEVKFENIWKRLLGIKDEDEAKRFSMEYELIVNPVYPMPHLEELLSVCKSKGIIMGIISNAQFYTPYLFISFLEKSFEELGFDHDLMLFSYEMGYGKPSLEMFARAVDLLEKKNIKKEEVLYVGNDMLKDMYPAAKTGFQTALFAGDGRSLNMREDDERCKKLRPDIIITDLIQILEYI
jgi:putative hydrolase of the HAD superfamily